MKTLACASLIIILMFITISHAKIDPETMIGVWLFDEGEGEQALDSSGKNNNGKLMNDPKWVDGKFGKALEFNGEDSYVEVENSDSLNPTDRISIVMWVKPYAGMDCDGNNNWRYLIDKGDWGSYHLIWESDWGNNEIGWTLKVGGANKRLWTNSGAPPDQWTHLGFTYDADEESKVYVNGKGEPGKSAQGPANGPIDIDTRVLKIAGGENGGCPNGAGFFNGIMDEVAIFNEALEEKDIQMLMNEGVEKFAPGYVVTPKDRLATTWGNIKKK